MAEALQAVAAPFSPPAHDRRRVVRWALISAFTLLTSYLLLQNPYWVPGGDSDFYVSVARTMAQGGPFEYNGLPVAICPPGWPWVMSKIMHISPTFVAIKLSTMLLMILSLVVSYFIALRFVRPATAGVAIILTGLLMPVYSLTYMVHSEALYCLCNALAMLLAFRLREGVSRWPGRIALLLLCIAIPLTRWTGMIQWIPIVAVLLGGRLGNGWVTRHWRTALACMLVMLGVWSVAWMQVYFLTADQLKEMKSSGGGPDSEVDADEQPNESTTVAIVNVSAKDNVFQEYGQRFLRSGKWFAWLLWQPTRFASVNKPADFVVSVVGWGVIGMLGVLAIAQARRGEWLWLSLAIYCGGLCMNWPNPNARYFVPVAPMLVLGFFVFIAMGREAYPPVAFDGWKWTRRLIVYSILLCNLAMFGVDVIVMRSPHFYDTFEAGQHRDLVNVAHFVMSLGPPPNAATEPTAGEFRPGDGDLVINERYENLNRVRFSNAGSRAMVLLTGLKVKALGRGKLIHQLAPPFTPSLGKEMQRVGGDWLLIQAPTVPWRVWHFRLPMNWYQRLSKNPDRPESSGWTLYHFERLPRTFTEQPVPKVEDWPRRVPGM